MSDFCDNLKKKTKNIMSSIAKPYTSAVITVGGSGTRMNTPDGCTKQFILLCGIPIVVRTLLTFQNSGYIDEIIVVSKPDEICKYEKIKKDYSLYKISKIVAGGQTRQESVLNGFKAINDKSEYVAIHDGVRCLVTEQNIKDTVKTAYAYGAACAATKETDTLKKETYGMYIKETVPREHIYRAQTPQVFHTDTYRACAFTAKKDNFIATDDCMLVENYGFKVKLVETGKQNLKITEPHDLIFAEAVINSRLPKEDDKMRIGHGYDVHRLTENRRLVLGGVEIPFEKGLAGHSDADVLIHAVTDAVLGAAGLGDIGLHFPDTDDKYLGISSMLLAKKANEIINEKGYYVNNIDATIVMQKPRLRPYIDTMRENIAHVFSVDTDFVNIKATTEENLGFTGNMEGVSSHAVCTVIKK